MNSSPSPSSLAIQLKALRQESTKGPWKPAFNHWGRSDIHATDYVNTVDSKPMPLLVNGVPTVRVCEGLVTSDVDLIITLYNNLDVIIEALEVFDNG